MLFRLSHYYYSMLGGIVVILVGLLISKFTREKNSTVRRELISPVMHWALPTREDGESIEYYTVDKALKIVKQNSNA